MKKVIFMGVLGLFLLGSCNSKSGDSHEGHNHETEEHNHDGHDHEGHDHEHEGHNHEHEEQENHAGERTRIFLSLLFRIRRDDGSQAYSLIRQVPHIGFPHAEPVTRAIKVNTAPMGAIAATARLAIFICQTRPINAATAIDA